MGKGQGCDSSGNTATKRVSRQAKGALESCWANLESVLRRLQYQRMPYRFYILKFSACISEDLMFLLLERAASQAYCTRIDEQSFGVLDIASSHVNHGNDIFLQALLRKLEEQYQRLSGTSWLPVVVERLEGRMDEISGVEDLLLLAASKDRGEDGKELKHSQVKSIR